MPPSTKLNSSAACFTDFVNKKLYIVAVFTSFKAVWFNKMLCTCLRHNSQTEGWFNFFCARLVPKVAPVNLRGGGGARGELVIMWEVRESFMSSCLLWLRIIWIFWLEWPSTELVYHGGLALVQWLLIESSAFLIFCLLTASVV